jgi:hypothetical protein
MEWIGKNLPDYKRQFLIGPGKNFCAGKDHILVDDADHNLKAFSEAGGLVVPIPRKWNEYHSWDTYDYMQNMLNKAMEIANAA